MRCARTRQREQHWLELPGGHDSPHPCWESLKRPAICAELERDRPLLPTASQRRLRISTECAPGNRSGLAQGSAQVREPGQPGLSLIRPWLRLPSVSLPLIRAAASPRRRTVPAMYRLDAWHPPPCICLNAPLILVKLPCTAQFPCARTPPDTRTLKPPHLQTIAFIGGVLPRAWSFITASA